MTLNELIEQLEDLRTDLGTGDGEVFVANQPTWPLTNVIANVVAEREIRSGAEHDVWIAVDQVGNHSDRSPYAPSEVWG